MPSKPHRVAVAALAVLAVLAVTACGSSGAKAGRPAPSHSQFLAFSQCMRSHGVPNFPDPSSGGGIAINSSSGINPASPSFQAAQKTCSKLLPGGGPGNQKPSAQAKAEMLAISECMRAHGVTGFPDPTTTPPSDPGAFALAEGRGGVFLAVPKSIDVSSPAFKRAAAACAFGPGPGARTASAAS